MRAGDRCLRRAAAALAGALWVALAVGLATALTAPTGHGWALGWRSAALLLPGLAVGLWLAAVALALTAGLRARGRALVAEHPQAVGAVALIVPPAAVLWLGVTTSLGRFFFTAFHHVGLAVSAPSRCTGGSGDCGSWKLKPRGNGPKGIAV